MPCEGCVVIVIAPVAAKSGPKVSFNSTSIVTVSNGSTEVESSTASGLPSSTKSFPHVDIKFITRVILLSFAPSTSDIETYPELSFSITTYVTSTIAEGIDVAYL